MKREEALNILASQVNFWSLEKLKKFSFAEYKGMLDSTTSTEELLEMIESAKNIVKVLDLTSVSKLP